MITKKPLFILSVLLLSGSILAAQNAAPAQTAAPAAPAVGEPDATKIGNDTAQQKLKEISIDKFEQPGFWISTMSPDEGIATGRLFESAGAKDKVQIPEEKALGIDPAKADKYVYGTKIEFYRRGTNEILIYPAKPLPIEGICKTISVWTVGRNYNHTLKLMLQDFFGRKYELYMGKLNFQGWKKLTVAIPPQGDDGLTGVVQRNYHYNSKMGIKILGFKIECDPSEAYGNYFIYLDDLRAVTDLFAEDNRDPDDMLDSW
jgi:hypothetical protein